ncbi:MAG TPA: flagellar assembly protein FliW [Polyangiaceae bacterium]|jgi:flagellar assembly factor FliW|nr:flagellar assembly protein FliW [Polyangiaceae bacterium]
MKINTTRFGTIECADDQTLTFPQGLIGFTEEHEFVMIPHGHSEMIAWLQSRKTPELAFPIVSAHAFAPDYPDVSVKESAHKAQLDGGPDSYAMLVILSAPRGQPATVNLLAPLVVNADTRRGAQVILENTRFSARELFVLPEKRNPEGEELSKAG